MPRWLRFFRGVIGTGFAFAAGLGAATAAVGTFFWLAGGPTVLQVIRTAAKFSVVGFLLGVAFSVVLGVIARGRGFSRLSLRLVSGLGAGAGTLYWLFLAMTGGRVWTLQQAIGNLVLLLAMGSGAASATLLLARRAAGSLAAGDDRDALGAGNQEMMPSRSRTVAEVPRE